MNGDKKTDPVYMYKEKLSQLDVPVLRHCGSTLYVCMGLCVCSPHWRSALQTCSG